jgi:hypothetical protein
VRSYWRGRTHLSVVTIRSGAEQPCEQLEAREVLLHAGGGARVRDEPSRAPWVESSRASPPHRP